MRIYDWMRKLLAGGLRAPSRRQHHWNSDSLVPRLSITRLEERRVLNADAAPVEVLVIDAGDAANDGQADTFQVEQDTDQISVLVNGQEVHSASADNISTIHLKGSADNDVLVADLLAGVLLVFDGDGGDDHLHIHGDDFDDVSYEVQGDGGGQIDARSATGAAKVNFHGVERVTDTLETSTREFTFTGPGHQVTLSGAAATDGSSQLTIDGTDGLLVEFTNPTESLRLDTTLNASAVPDQIEIDGLDNTFNADLIVAGSPHDALVLLGTTDLGSGDLSISTGSIVLNQTLTSGGGQFDLQADQSFTVNDDGGLQNNGGRVRVEAAEIQLTGYISTAGGVVELDSGDNGLTTIAGWIDVSQSAIDGQGGVVHLLGGSVALLAGARIDASGSSGGGTVLVGGDYQGKHGAVRNAATTYISSNVLLVADAITMGDGGKVIVWADQVTRFYGSISARGGAEGGNGGLVETSGKNHLVADGSVNASAPAGNGGIWLLDPRDVDLVQLTDDTTDDSTDGSFDGGTPNTFTPDNDADAVVAQADIFEIENSLEGGTHVVITTTAAAGTGNGDITVVDDINVDLSATAGAQAVTLTLIADRNIIIDDSITLQGINNSSDQLSLTLTATGNVNINSPIDLDAGGTGGIFISTGVDFDNNVTGAGTITTGGGSITITHTGTVAIDASITTAGGSFIASAVTFDSSGQTIDTSGADDTDGGNVQITTTGQLTTGAINTTGGNDTGFGGAENAGDVALSGGDVTLVATISATGGDDANTNAQGGTGGSITLSATDGDPLITIAADVDSSGGAGVTIGDGGDITLNDPAAISSPIEILAGNATLLFNDSLGAGSNALTLSADDISFAGGANTVAGTGTLLLQPSADDISIDIGSPGGTPGDLDLSDTDLAALADGFVSVTIGRLLGAHTIVVGTASFKDPVTIRTPSGGSIQVNGQLDTLAGAGAITLIGSGATTTLNANLVTAGAAIDIQDSVVIDQGENILLDTTNGGAVAAGAAIDIEGALNGTGGGGSETLSLNAGTGGAATINSVSGNTGSVEPLNLTIIHSGSTTISGTAALGTLDIQDTTGTVTLAGNATITTLTTAAMGYGVTLLGSLNTITNDTNFLNTGAVTLGDNANDVILFDGGISVAGLTPTNLHGRLQTSGDQIDLGTVTLLGNSVIDATNNSANASGANVNLGNITGSGFSLTVDAGTAGNVTLTQVGAAGTALAALTLDANLANLNGNVFADSQDYNADVVTSSRLDTTNGGANPNGGMVDIAGALTGGSPQINGGTTGVVTINSVSGATTLIALTIINSGATTLSGAATLGTLDLQDTTGTVTLAGNATITTLTTAAMGYGVTLLGSLNTITNDTNFLNTGAVTLGDNANDVILFDGGISVAGLTPTNLHGRLRTSGDQIDLGSVTLLGNSVIDTNNNGAMIAGAAINLASVTGNVNDLEFNGGTGGPVTVTGSSLNLSTLTLTQTSGATFQGNVVAISLVTTAQPYGITLLGSSNTITNDTNFFNTGAITLGNNANDVFLFDGGIDTTTGPPLVNLFGRLRTSGDQIDLGPVTLLGNSVIDATNNGSVTTGDNVNLGNVTGSGFLLAVDAGTAGDATLALVGAAGTALAALTVDADTTNLNGNVFANSQDFSANLTVSESLNLLLDTTNAAANPNGGMVDIEGSLNGTLGGAGETLRINAGINGAVTINSVSGATGSVEILDLTIVNSTSTTVGGTTTLGTLSIQDTNGVVTIQGDATITTLTTAAMGYGVTLLGSSNVITNDTNFLNTGAVTLGDNANDVVLFDGGVSTITGPTLTNLHGRLRTSGDPIDLGPVTLLGNSVIDNTFNGANAAVATINLHGVLEGTTANTDSLDLDSSAAAINFMAAVGAATPLGDITIALASNVTASSTFDASNLVQTAGTGVTDLQDDVTVSGSIDITTDTIRLHGAGPGTELMILATGASSTVQFDAMTAAKLDFVDVIIDTSANAMGGIISDQILAQSGGRFTALDLSIDVSAPLAPLAVIIAEIDVEVSDTLGQNFTVEVNWRLAEGPPVAPIVTVPPTDILADAIDFTINGNITQQFDHQFNDNPEPDPADDINVGVSITQFAGDTINLFQNGINLLADNGISTVVVILVDAPLFSFVLLPTPEPLPAGPPPRAPLAPLAAPAPFVAMRADAKALPNTAGLTGHAELRYYELRIVSFDQDGRLVETSDQRINLSDPRLEAIAPFNPSKLPELFKRLPGDRYRVYLIEDGAERLMIEFVIERVGDEGRPVELPERIEADPQPAHKMGDASESAQPEAQAQRPLVAPALESLQRGNGSFSEQLGRASFVSSSGLLFGAALLSKSARLRRQVRADLRMAAFRKRLRTRVRTRMENSHWPNSKQPPVDC